MNSRYYLIIVWIICGVISYGINFAYYQRKWPSIAQEGYREDMIFCAGISLLGPANLLGSIVLFWHRNGFRHIFMYGFKIK